MIRSWIDGRRRKNDRFDEAREQLASGPAESGHLVAHASFRNEAILATPLDPNVICKTRMFRTRLRAHASGGTLSGTMRSSPVLSIRQNSGFGCSILYTELAECLEGDKNIRLVANLSHFIDANFPKHFHPAAQPVFYPEGSASGESLTEPNGSSLAVRTTGVMSPSGGTEPPSRHVRLCVACGG
jgi:hypothetical protein